MSAKLAPKPWRAAFKSSKSNNIGVYDSSGNLVADLSVHVASSVEVIERRFLEGCLMASSLDLLEALEALVSLHESLDPTGAAMDDFNAARAAIAKARGQS